MRWFEELWEFRLRREKGCLWGPSTGEGSVWARFLEEMKVGHLPHQPDRRPMCIALREGPNCQREASWGSGSPNTGTGEGLFPTSLTIALGKSLQGATALVVVQSELH